MHEMIEFLIHQIMGLETHTLLKSPCILYIYLLYIYMIMMHDHPPLACKREVVFLYICGVSNIISSTC